MRTIPGFNMQPFSRVAWVSTAARATWAGAVQACSELVQALEVESVAAGQRACSWQTVRREQLPEFSERNARLGLATLPVQWVGDLNGFIHYTPKGDSSAYCIVARRIEDALEFRDAFKAGDHGRQGEKLGFPKCCRDFFAREWAAGFFDPVWQSACGDYPLEMPEGNRLRVVQAHPYSNPLLRYVGLRVGFHIPHSFSCAETVASGAERLSLARDRGAVRVLDHLLSMPMEAELLHGILVVRTPIFYVIQYSVPTEEKYTIRVDGEFVPKEGAWPAKARS